MRVMHLLSATGMHGAETMTLQLASASRHLGVDAVVGLFDRGDAVSRAVANRFEEASIPIVRFRDRRRFDLRLCSELAAYTVRNGIDVLHSHKTKCTLHALTRRSAPLVVTYHNWIATTKVLRFYALLDRLMCRFVDARVAVSSGVAQILEGASGRVVHQIDNGVDLERWRPAACTGMMRGQHERAQALVVGFVGRLGPEKGLDLLLEAVAKVPCVNGRELRLMVAGEGESRPELEALSGRLGLSNRVTFLGECKDPASVYAGSDVIALTSVTEGFPMVAIEAMASGRPVLATAVGDLPRMIVPGVTGWLVSDRDPDLLAKLIQTELGDVERLKTMGDAARASAERQFSSVRMAAAYLDIYRAVLRARMAD